MGGILTGVNNLLFGKAPKAPKPATVAQQQWDLTKKAMDYGASTSAVNQYSPYGSTTYKRNKAGVPTAQTVAMSPVMKKTFDVTNATRNKLLGTAQTRAATPWQMPDQARADEVARTMYARKWGQVAPEYARQQKSLDVMLNDRGIPLGSEISNDERNRFSEQQAQTQEALAQDAELAAGQESNRLLQQSLTERAQPFNEATAYAGGTPISIPQFQSTPSYSPSAPDITSLTNQNYQQQQQQYDQNTQDFWSGITGLGKAAVSHFLPA